MTRRIVLPALALLLLAGADLSADQKPAEQPKPTDLPGITSPDRTPQACVNCHANHPEMKADHRLTTLVGTWRNGSDPAIVAKAKAAAPAGVALEGKHPDIAGKVKVVPTDCLKCHGADSKYTPPFKRLLYLIHVAGGTESHFLARGNACTNCHKLDRKSGAWGMGSGKEK